MDAAAQCRSGQRFAAPLIVTQTLIVLVYTASPTRQRLGVSFQNPNGVRDEQE
jgi:hypothetical protein